MDNDIHYIRKELDRLQVKFQEFDVETKYAMGNDDSTAPTTGWSDEKPTPIEGKFIWVQNTIQTPYGVLKLEPYCLGDGLVHILNIQVQYIAWNDPYIAPSQDNTNWQDTAPSLVAGYYIWTRNKMTTTEGIEYSDAVRMTGEKGESGQGISIKGDKGDAGKGYDFIYFTSSSTTPPTTPSSDVTRYSNEYEKWCDYPTPVDATHKYIYMSLRVSNVSGEWGNWSTPILNSSLGERGRDGEGYEIIFYQSQTEKNWSTISTYQNPSNIPTTATGFQDADYVPTEYGWTDDSQGVDSTYKFEYACHRTRAVNTTTGVGSWDSFSEPVLWNTFSEDGSSQYIHIRYSDVNNPVSSSQVFTTIKNYIGIYIDDTEETSGNQSYYNNPSLYSWQKFKPTKGVDYDGRFLHMKYADSITFDANNNVTAITWTGNDGEDGGAWLGTLFDENSDDPSPLNITTANLFTWTKIQGDDGEGMNFAYYTTNNASYTGYPTGTLLSGNSKTANAWCDSVYPVSSSNPYLYVSTKPTGSNTWTNASLMSRYGLDGASGSNGTGYEFAYYTTNGTPNPATPSTVYTNGNYDSWQKSLVPINSSHTKVYISYRTKNGSSYSAWSSYALFSEKGDRGATGYDGKGFEMIFTTSDTQITAWNWTGTQNGKACPNNVSTSASGYQNAGFLPTGWTNDPTGVSRGTPFEYASVRTSNASGVWGQFSVPALFGRFGDDGVGIEFIYKLTNSATAPAKPQSQPSDDYVPSGWTDDPSGVASNNQYEWVCQRTKTSGSWSDFSTPSLWAKFGANGSNGVNSYTHVRYSGSSDGANMTANYINGQKYMGVQTSSSSTASSNPSNYKWSLIKGEDGVSPDVNQIIDTVQENIDTNNIDAVSVGGVTIEELLQKTPVKLDPINQSGGGGSVTCQKIGFLVVVSVNNWNVTATSGSGWVYFKQGSNDLTIGSDYRPTSSNVIVGGGSMSGNLQNGWTVILGTDGRIRTKNETFNGTGNTHGVSAVFVFFRDNRTNSSLTLSNPSTIYYGDSITATLKNSSNTALSSKTVVFKANGVYYSRTTNASGQGSLTLRLSPASYTITGQFNGDSTYNSSFANKTITVSKSNPTFTFDKSAGATIEWGEIISGSLKNANGTVASNIQVTVAVSGGKTFTTTTDTIGRFSVYARESNVVFDGTAHNVTVSISNNTYFNNGSLTRSFKFGG